MEKKRDGLMTAIGIIMTAGGAIGILIWIFLLLFGVAWTGGPPAFERSVSTAYLAAMAIGLIGAIFGLITGIKVIATGAEPRRQKTVLAGLAALAPLPGSVVLSVMYWFPMAVVVLLMGFLPPVLYLVKIFKASRKIKQEG